MMKVKICNKKLWANFIKNVSAVATVLSLVFTVVDIDQKLRLIILAVILAILVIIFLIMWYMANHTNEKKLKITSTDGTIKYGDLFEENGIKVIAFNEYFDTQVDNKIIAESSLNGVFINEYSDGASTIDAVIDNEMRLRKNIIKDNMPRPYGGKSIKYKLGSICPYAEFFLLALSHFDDDNKAYISVEDYISCLMHMWNELDAFYAGRPIVLPLLGSGITRFNNSDITPQELLKYILMTFKASKVKFNNTSSLTIVLNDKIRDDINLFDIQED